MFYIPVQTNHCKRSISSDPYFKAQNPLLL